MNTTLSGHAVGIILKELMRRAIVTIRNERQVFEATVKRGYRGDMDDVFTSADTKAQAIYMKSLRQCFPDIPVIAEEGTTALGTASPTYFTVDPGRRVPDKVALDACDRRALDAEPQARSFTFFGLCESSHDGGSRCISGSCSP